MPRKVQPNDRLPPQDLDAEKALLGAMLVAHTFRSDWVDADFAEIRAIVGPEAFYVPAHAIIFRVMLESRDAGEPVDGVAILPRLNAAEDRDDWPEILNTLADAGDPANGLFYCRAIRRAFQLRELIRVCHRTANECFASVAPDPSAITAALAKSIEAIDDTGADREAVHEGELLQRMENPASRMAEKVPVGLGWLNRNLDGGLDLGTLTIIGARTSCGKTSLALSVALHASRAGDDGCPVLYVSAEMSIAELALRLYAMRTGIPLSKLRAGELDEPTFTRERNQAALAAKSGRGIWLLDGVTDARAIAAAVRRYARREGVRLAIVDFLGLLSIPGEFERHDLRIGAMTRLFKQSASDAGVALLVLSQLNRGSANENREPRLSDLRDSGSIEQDADVVLLIHRGKDTPEPIAESKIIIAKHRQGATGSVDLGYNKKTLTFHTRTATGDVPSWSYATQ